VAFNKESNGFIFIFLTVMVLVVATSLSFVSEALKPIITKNEEIDKKTQILKSVIIVPEAEEKTKFTKDFVESTYQTGITEMVVDYQGNVKEGVNAFKLDFKKELKKPEAERSYPVYKYTEGAEAYYIISLEGLGLWDRIWGYMAVNKDLNTIKGATFDHKGETPGLGARITEYGFRSQFQKEKLFSDNEYNFSILKGEANEAAVTDAYKVDGLSGATITSTGVNDMLEKCVKLYQPFFDLTKQN